MIGEPETLLHVLISLSVLLFAAKSDVANPKWVATSWEFTDFEDIVFNLEQLELDFSLICLD